MRLCLLTTDGRQSPGGERIAALANALRDPVIVTAGSDRWPDAVPIDELADRFDAAIAFGWHACLHVFRAEAKSYAYRLPALEEAQLWQGDERRLLAALTYDLPLTLIAPNRAVARALEERAPGRRIVVVEPGVDRAPATTSTGEGPLRVASATPAGDILGRANEPLEPADIASADVLLELVAADSPLAATQQALVRGVVPVVTPVDGHEELVTDGESGIVIGFDDVPGAARALDVLARDRDLLGRLRAGARKLPSVEDEAKALQDAVKKPARVDGWPARLLLNARAAAEPIAQERRALDSALRSYEERIQHLTEENESLRARLDEQARAYRVGKKLEPLWGPVARRRDK